MASTSTNKQPLLVDNVLHVALDLNAHKVAVNSATPGVVGGANTAVKLLDCIGRDGAVIESMYTISRDTSEYSVNLYLATSGDYLRPEQSVFIGQIKSSAAAVYTKTYVDDLPPVLAPVAHTGSESQLRALYVPRGQALWAGVEVADINPVLSKAPILGIQGGNY